MNKAQKIVAGFFAIAILVIAVLFFISLKSPNDSLPSGIVFYYGETCPHCKLVEEFMASNNATSRINVTMKESFSNLVNGDELIKIGSYCKLAKENLGAVPLVYSDGKCYLGDTEAINFLKTKLNSSTSTQ